MFCRPETASTDCTVKAILFSAYFFLNKHFNIKDITIAQELLAHQGALVLFTGIWLQVGGKYIMSI